MKPAGDRRVRRTRAALRRALVELVLDGGGTVRLATASDLVASPTPRQAPRQAP